MDDAASHDGLLQAYILDGEGGGKPLDWLGVRACSIGQGLLWIHLDYGSQTAQDWLREHSGLSSTQCDALLVEDSHPRLAVQNDGLLLTLRAINFNPGAEPEDMVSVRCWCDTHKIITLRHRRVHSISELLDSVSTGSGPIGVSDFLACLTTHIIHDVVVTIDAISETLDTLEERLVDVANANISGELASVRRDAINVRRHIAPQREALFGLAREKLSWLTRADRDRIQEAIDRNTHAIEELDLIRDRAALTREEISRHLSEQLNRRLLFLSMITATFLPLSFVTGLLGMNVGGLPGLGNPLAFWIVCGTLAVVVIIELAILTYRRWF